MRQLSILVPLKNRSRIQVPWKNGLVWIEPFQKNLQALRRLVRHVDQWQICIVDFHSTDVDLAATLSKQQWPSNVKIDIQIMEGSFSRGKAINAAFANGWLLYDTVLTLDADMQIGTPRFFDDLFACIGRGHIFFPVCWSYKDPQHRDGWKRTSGTGIVAHTKKDFVPLMENTKWGLEDTANQKHFESRAERPFQGHLQVHQWHPNDEEFKNKEYK